MDHHTLLEKYPVSASQQEWFLLCRKKWAARNLFKIRKPRNKWAERGDKCHKTIENWQEGQPIDFDSEEGRIVAPALRFLPAPGLYQQEEDFRYKTENAVYRGRKDLRGVEGSVRVVWDYKTTGHFKWVKSIGKLRRDVQAMTYAVSEVQDALSLGEDLQRVEMNWLYMLADPKKPRARKVQLHVLTSPKVPIPGRGRDVRPDNFGFMYLDEVQERFSEIEATSLEMLKYRKDFDLGLIEKLEDVPYDTRGCDQFGGCPYRNEECKLSVSEKIRARETKMKIKMSDKIKETKEEEKASSKDSKDPKGSASTVKPSAEMKAEGERTKKTPPQTNPPEQKKGRDPDAPSASPSDRMGTAVEMAKAIVASRIVGLEHPERIADEAVKLTDALIERLS